MRDSGITRLSRFAVYAVLAALPASTVSGGTTVWDCAPGTPGDWGNNSNWTDDEPDADDDAHINNGGTARVTQAGEVCRYLRMGYDATGVGTVAMTGGGLAASREEIGYYGTGTFNQSAGTHSVASSVMLGYWIGSQGDYSLTGTGVLDANAATVWVGIHGSSTFVQDGADTLVEVASLRVGLGAGGAGAASHGTYNIEDGRLTAGEIRLDYSGGHATFGQLGGTVDVASDLEMSARYSSGSSTYWLYGGGALNIGGNITGGVGDSRLYLHGGTLDMTHGGSISVRGLYLGASAGTSYTQSGAEDVTVRRRLFVGDYRRGGSFAGTYNMDSSGTLSVGRYLYVAHYGSGQFNQTDGTVEDIYQLILGGHSGSQGGYSLDGAASGLSATYEIVGWRGTGEFTQDGGTNTASRLILGKAASGSGAYTLNAGQLDSNSGPGCTYSQYVGYVGDGVFNHNGGRNTVDCLWIAYAGGDGRYVLDSTGPGGDDLLADRIVIGRWRGSGVFDHIDGTSTAGEVLLLGWRGDANYVMAGGTLNVGTLAVDGPRAVFNQDGGEVNVTGASTLVVEGDGVYDLVSGDLNADVEEIGSTGGGTFRQSGGVNTVGKLHVGTNPFATGTHFNSFSVGRYEKTGGVLHVTGALCAYVGEEGIGVFEHDSGDCSVDGTLHVGYGETGDGTYALRGTAHLDANTAIRVGADSGLGRLAWHDANATISTPRFSLGPKGTLAMGYSFDVADLAGGALFSGGATNVSGLGQGTLEITNGATATHGGGLRSFGALRVGSDANGGAFSHQGGQVTAGYVEVNRFGAYDANGGMIQITGGGLHLDGNMDLGGQAVTINVNSDSLVHLTGDNFENKSGLVLNIDSNTLTFFDPGSDPFDGVIYYNSGREHHLGDTLIVSSWQSYTFTGHVPDPVEVNGGSVTATPNGFIHMTGGLDLWAGAAVNLGTGTCTCNGGYFGSDCSVLEARNEVIGDSNTAFFDQNGGTNTVAETLYLGRQASGDGTYSLDGNGTLSAGSIVVGYGGTGTFHHRAGDVEAAYDLLLGYKSGSHGEYVCWSVTSNLMGGFAVKCASIGYEGTGVFTQENGTVTINGTLAIGDKAGSDGVYTLKAGSLDTDTLAVGVDGNGTLDVQDASVQVSVRDTLSLGSDSHLSAVAGSTIHLTGASFENFATDPNDLAGLGNLTLVFEGGPDVDTFEAAGQFRGGEPAGWSNNFVLDRLTLGGQADVGNVKLVDLADNAADPNDEALYANHLTVGSGSELDLNGLALYVGSSIVQQGTVQLGDGAIGGTTLTNDGTITGPGTIEADVLNRSLVSPGDSPGLIEIDGDYTQDAGATLRIELAGAGLDDYDRLAVTGNVNLAGTLDVLLIDTGAGTFAPQFADAFDLLDWGSRSGEFDAVNLPGLADGLRWDTADLYVTGTLRVAMIGDATGDGVVDAADYIILKRNLGTVGGASTADGDFTGDGNVDWADLQVLLGAMGAGGGSAVIPEPATLALLALGTAALLRRPGRKAPAKRKPPPADGSRRAPIARQAP